MKSTASSQLRRHRRISTVVLVISLIAGAFNYWHKWHPDIPFWTFFGAMVGLLVMQLLLTFTIIMPIVTTLERGGG